MGFSTDAIHAGQKPDPSTGAIITPIFQTSTYVQDSLGQHKGYEYARTQNPTREAVEANIAKLENGVGGVAFASGMASIQAIMTFVKQGDRVVSTGDTYGGTYRFFENIMRPYGVEFTYVDSSNLDELDEALSDDVRMVYLETPTNPILRITDIAAVAERAQAIGARTVVDNTFMSPYLQRPLELGATLVLHSTTKFLNGHSDSIGGMVVCADEEDLAHLRYVQNAAGAILSPFDSWLLLRSTKTLALRMERHNQNGMAMAEYLANHPKVEEVFYPGLESHPHHELAATQMDGFGAMISFETGSLQNAKRVLENFEIFSLAESLGGVESLLCHPASMTHASIPEEDRKRYGVTDGLVRFSVGVEDIEDLTADAERALSHL